MKKFHRNGLHWVMVIALIAAAPKWWNQRVHQETSYRTAQFRPLWVVQPVKENMELQLLNGDTLKLEQLKFYVSHMTLLLNGKVMWRSDEEGQLIDALHPEKSSIRLPAIPCNELRFLVGLDSATNCSGNFNGALDPVHGMFWSWQSGFIHFKIEGTSTACTERNNRFQYHLGGYRKPYETSDTVSIPITSGESIGIPLHVDRYFSLCSPAQQGHVMSPGKNAKELFQHALKMFAP
ncbi:MAG: hypothetical protein LW750_09365 [Bacteroidetes bacterium]|jgi:hypothetical protein|nr:hypothetical protein [Bacteroidota bacterium]